MEIILQEAPGQKAEPRLFRRGFEILAQVLLLCERLCLRKANQIEDYLGCRMDWTTENIKWFFQQPPPRGLDETLLEDALNVLFPKMIRVVFYVLPVLMLIMAGMVLTILVRTTDLKGEWLLMTEPIVWTSGKVLEIEKIKGSKGSITYAYTFEFKPVDREALRDAPVRGICFSGDAVASVGQQVSIEYLPDRPKISRIEGCRLNFTPLAAIVVIPLLGAVTAILPLGMVRYKKNSLQRLLSHGVLASAFIEKIKPGAKGSLAVGLRYAVNGAEVEAKSNISGRKEVKTWLKSLHESGQAVLILSDPRKPKNIFMLELLLHARKESLPEATG